MVLCCLQVQEGAVGTPCKCNWYRQADEEGGEDAIAPAGRGDQFYGSF